MSVCIWGFGMEALDFCAGGYADRWNWQWMTELIS